MVRKIIIKLSCVLIDLDCCGIIMVGDKIMCTKRTKYSLDNNINYFDPERASPSYIYRLAKYKTRGFDIELPLFDERKVDFKSINEFFNDNVFRIEYYNYGYMMALKTYTDDDVPISDKITDEMIIKWDKNPEIVYMGEVLKTAIKLYNNIEKVFENKINIMLPESIFSYDKYENIYKESSLYSDFIDAGEVYDGDKYRTENAKYYSNMLDLYNKLESYKSIIFCDDKTKLILAKYYSVCPPTWKIYDYKEYSKRRGVIHIDGGVIAYGDDYITYAGTEFKKYSNIENFPVISRKFKSEWKNINPMEQLTNTFQPEIIGNLEEWYYGDYYGGIESDIGPRKPDLIPWYDISYSESKNISTIISSKVNIMGKLRDVEIRSAGDNVIVTVDGEDQNTDIIKINDIININIIEVLKDIGYKSKEKIERKRYLTPIISLRKNRSYNWEDNWEDNWGYNSIKYKSQKYLYSY